MNPRDEASGDLKPFLEHLEDFRTMLIRCAIALGIGVIVSFPFVNRILAWLKAPLASITDRPDRFLQTLEVTGAFSAAMTISIWSGLLVSAPFLLLFIGAFILPALTPREKKVITQIAGFAVALFVAGVALGYVFTLPFALQAMFFFNKLLGIEAMWTLTSYIGFATQLLIAFGLAFEMPVVILILGRLGIVTADQLRGKRRHAFLAILVIGAILTPPDVISQLIMSLPLYALFEVSLFLIARGERRNLAQGADA